MLGRLLFAALLSLVTSQAIPKCAYAVQPNTINYYNGGTAFQVPITGFTNWFNTTNGVSFELQFTVYYPFSTSKPTEGEIIAYNAKNLAELIRDMRVSSSGYITLTINGTLGCTQRNYLLITQSSCTQLGSPSICAFFQQYAAGLWQYDLIAGPGSDVATISISGGPAVVQKVVSSKGGVTSHELATGNYLNAVTPIVIQTSSVGSGGCTLSGTRAPNCM